MTGRTTISAMLAMAAALAAALACLVVAGPAIAQDKEPTKTTKTTKTIVITDPADIDGIVHDAMVIYTIKPQVEDTETLTLTYSPIRDLVDRPATSTTADSSR